MQGVQMYKIKYINNKKFRKLIGCHGRMSYIFKNV